MTDLTDWLAAIHAADERAAREATPGPWRVNEVFGVAVEPAYPSGTVVAAYTDVNVYHGAPEGEAVRAEDARQSARHDPQSVLARIEAERMLIKPHLTSDFPFVGDDGEGGSEYSWAPYCDGCSQEWPCPTLRALAWGYRGRDGYRADLWAPEGVEVGA